MSAKQGFTEEEQAAMKARARELKAEARADKKRAEGEKAVLDAIAEMSEPDRTMAMRSTRSSRRTRRTSGRRPGTGCPRMPRTARHLLLPARGEVQGEVRDARLQRRSESRRRRHVADLVRSEGVDPHRRGKDRRACEESCELNDAGRATSRTS